MTVAPCIRAARDPDDLDLCRTLMREYAAHLNASAGGGHICVSSLEQELDQLPVPYSPPVGALLLAVVEEQPVGLVALRPLPASRVVLPGDKACEMKRLWVRLACQGQGLGRWLTEAALQQARHLDYNAIYLDTLPATMPRAYALYRSLGFAPLETAFEAQPGSQILYLRRSL
jgi:GNAT superfamily N-acetyltransferase